MLAFLLATAFLSTLIGMVAYHCVVKNRPTEWIWGSLIAFGLVALFWFPIVSYASKEGLDERFLSILPCAVILVALTGVYCGRKRRKKDRL